MGVGLAFPLIADLDMRVAKTYGMLHPNESTTEAVRALFVIDPKRVVRALIYYPLNVGRSVDEVLRLLDGLQLASEHGMAAPVGWKQGEPVVVPPPKTLADVDERKSHKEYQSPSFYLNKTACPAPKPKPVADSMKVGAGANSP